MYELINDNANSDHKQLSLLIDFLPNGDKRTEIQISSVKIFI
jgi:hypothetical protein